MKRSATDTLLCALIEWNRERKVLGLFALCIERGQIWSVIAPVHYALHSGQSIIERK